MPYIEKPRKWGFSLPQGSVLLASESRLDFPHGVEVWEGTNGRY